VSAGEAAGIRICFCDLGGRPYEDLSAHDPICLEHDRAMAQGRVSPLERLRQLDSVTRDLGITEEEMAAEAACWGRGRDL